VHRVRETSRVKIGRVRDLKLPTIFDQFREARSEEPRQIQATQPKPQKRHSNCYDEVPCDLDRIADARSSVDVLEVVNDVLEILERCGRMQEIPEALRRHTFSAQGELHDALRIVNSRIHSVTAEEQSVSDAAFVLRTVLNAAEERLQQLGKR